MRQRDPTEGQEGREEGERPHPTKNKLFLMIDTDSTGLVGPDESEGLGDGSGGQDLWLASCCQLKGCLKPPCPAKYAHMHHLCTLILLHLLCLTTPSSAPLPAAIQTNVTNTRITHTVQNASAHPGASETNRGWTPSFAEL